jgi:ribosomal protein S8
MLASNNEVCVALQVDTLYVNSTRRRRLSYLYTFYEVLSELQEYVLDVLERQGYVLDVSDLQGYVLDVSDLQGYVLDRHLG